MKSRDEGSERASWALFEDLYLANRDTVLRYLRVRVDESDALDLAALTFERAYKAMSAGGTVNVGWLLRTARNAAVDAGRRQRTRRLLETIIGRLGPESAPSPETQVILDETAASVRRAVRALPAAQRDAVAFRYASGLTAREIGSILGKSEAATQKLISRALDRLRETLHDQA